jgi:hypothetical protein
MPRRWPTVCILLALAATGCQREQPRGIVGAVTLDGKPLDEAVILFVPLEPGQKKTGAPIVDGRYELAKEVGILPGNYRVEVADNPPLNAATHRDAMQRKSSRRPFPHRYSTDSPLTLELTRDDDNEFNFELESRVR